MNFPPTLIRQNNVVVDSHRSLTIGEITGRFRRRYGIYPTLVKKNRTNITCHWLDLGNTWILNDVCMPEKLPGH